MALVPGITVVLALPSELAIYLGFDGEPNTVVSTLLGVLLIPALVAAVFLYPRSGQVSPALPNRTHAWSGLLVVAGTAYLQLSHLVLSLDPTHGRLVG